MLLVNPIKYLYHKIFSARASSRENYDLNVRLQEEIYKAEGKLIETETTEISPEIDMHVQRNYDGLSSEKQDSIKRQLQMMKIHSFHNQHPYDVEVNSQKRRTLESQSRYDAFLERKRLREEFRSKRRLEALANSWKERAA